MIRVDFRTKKNGVPILSKDEIEYSWAIELGYGLADIFQVSVTAAKIRLKNLRFIRDHEERQFSLNLSC